MVRRGDRAVGARRGGAAAALAVTMGCALAPGHALAESCDALPDLRLADPLNLAVVKPDIRRAQFYRSGPSCPGFRKTCRETAYVVAGDTVIVSGGTGDFVCAHYVAPRKRGDASLPEVVRSGWLNAAELTMAPAAAPTDVTLPDFWPGVWRRVEAQIVIKAGATPGMLALQADATFGALDPERVKRGGVNIGEFAGEARSAGAALDFAVTEAGLVAIARGADDACKVWLRRVGPWLLADDNNMCGGANVSFRGLYSRDGG